MIAMSTLQLAQESLDTGGVRDWILDNIIPLLLLVVALLLLWLGGGKGDNAGVIIGLAVSTDAGENIGKWIAGLFTS
jgi:hypothetical protein